MDDSKTLEAQSPNGDVRGRNVSVNEWAALRAAWCQCETTEGTVQIVANGVQVCCDCGRIHQAHDPKQPLGASISAFMVKPWLS